MPSLITSLPLGASLFFLVVVPQSTYGSDALLKSHCAACHGDEDPEGEFSLNSLGSTVAARNIHRWLDALDRVTAEEMPPKDDSQLSKVDRQKLISYLKRQLTVYGAAQKNAALKPRRLNNREFENCVRDVRLI